MSSKQQSIAMCRQIQALAVSAVRHGGANLTQSQIRDAYEAFSNVRKIAAEQLED